MKLTSIETNSNSSFYFKDPRPAPGAVELGPLLDEISRVIRTHVVLSEQAAAALALWVVHTYVYQTRDAVAYVSIESPEKRCGKTTLLSVLAGLAWRALVASNVTVGALFRVIDDARPTLLIDEADTFLGGNGVMRGIINCGNTWRTAYVLRLSSRKRRRATQKGGAAEAGVSSGESPDSNFVRYSCWCPKVIAMIGRVPDTIADRSIVVRLERKLVSEKCAPLSDFKPESITAKCVRFAQDNSERIAEAALETAPALNDRAADTFEPLFVLARLAGPDWHRRAAAAAVFLTAPQNTETAGSSVLLDILALFIECGKDKLFSRSIVSGLRGDADWTASSFFAGRTLNELVLAQTLRSYGIKPINVRIGPMVNKGYRLEDFQRGLSRYVPESEIKARIEEIRAGWALRQEAAAEAAAQTTESLEQRA